MKRPCLTCGQPTATGSRCEEHRLELERARSTRRRLRGESPHHGPGSAAYRKLRAAAVASLPLTCAICGEPITTVGNSARSLTLDHIVPRSRGGSDDASNLRFVHRSCNATRGARP